MLNFSYFVHRWGILSKLWIFFQGYVVITETITNNRELFIKAWYEHFSRQ